MSYQPFLIAGFQTGLETNLEPWLLPQDAFQSIINGHVHNSVLQKRAGMSLFGNMPNGATNPIMGIKNFTADNGEEKILIFDTKRAAIYNDATQVFDALQVGGVDVDIFNGTESSFISSAAFGKTKAFTTSTFFFTNFNGDTVLLISPIRTYTTGTNTFTFEPDTTPTLPDANYIVAAQFIFSIRSRLILLNTVENTTRSVGTPPVSAGGTNFAQRMRWCRSFNPSQGDAHGVVGGSYPWDELTPGNGGFVDASTSERIVGATQLEDTILVQFTNSVWIIEPTSDPALPFRWVKVNSYRTTSAPYANIAHDNFVISYGTRGIVASSRNEVKRIDDKIEDFMMEEINADFAFRMYSGRDFTHKRAWTLYPSSVRNINPANEATTSNYALIRSDDDGSWSLYDVTLKDQDPVSGTNLSCLGYGSYEIDTTFDDFPNNSSNTFASPVADNNWTDFVQQAETEVFLAGDQTGRIIALNSGGDDLGVDIDFEVVSAGWNPYMQEGKQAQMGYVDLYMDADKNTTFTVDFYVDDITSPYTTQEMNCLPNLGFLGDIVNITNTNPAIFNVPSHGLNTGDVVYIYGVNGMKDVTAGVDVNGGPYTITFINYNYFSISTIDGTAYSVYEGGGQVVQRAYENMRCWKRVYAGAKGYQHFMKITNSSSNNTLNFHAFKPHFRPIGNRIIGG